jgi:hypothetical protein
MEGPAASGLNYAGTTRNLSSSPPGLLTSSKRQTEAGREQILAVDLDSQSYTFSSANCMMESVRSKFDPNVRIMVDP